ncbi:DASH complex subunit Dad4 [Phascolomyces articulosus]|uniref:DASH complex subunit DAD4 n=1 Tax=Phascolomyces articulosus TaxID=60185 RepID=A0AAD5JP73_9FUNG|nr:DASH complex subunit Dad4 [Phascolomyces articulosus]
MENPYEQAQNALLGRIVQNVTRLSEAVDNLNERMEEVNKENSDLAVIGQMFSSYWFSSQMYLQTTRKSYSDKK